MEALLPEKDPEVVLETVGVTGLEVSLTGDVGESRSLEPVESFVLFFFKKPSDGIEAAVEECTQPWLDLGAAASGKLGQCQQWNAQVRQRANCNI